MVAKAPHFEPGAILPGTKYRVVREIGAGGMGVVYQVVKPPEIMGVLKLMSSELTAHQEFRTRFFDEVRVLAQLDHPNIVRVFDYDSLTDGTPYYVMELLHGRTVRDVLATMSAIPPRVAFEVTRQLCEALHAAHTNDIPVVHRDIKPENIFLHAPRHGEPVVKLIDFGVVAVGDRQHDGQFVGTWKYAAPEQIRGERGTPATDLYAVGLVLYEMLCGIGPFEELDTGSLVSQAHLTQKPPPVSKFAPWVPPSIVQLIDACLAKNPRHRPRDAHELAERLYELEWANDGKDPSGRAADGPLSRILSTVGDGRADSKNLEAPAATDRLSNVPVIGVPAEARHDGPTIKGMGAKRPPGATPQMPQVVNRVANEGGAADAKVVVAEGGAAPPVRSGRVDTDTFSSQESDTRRTPKAKNGKIVAAVLLVAVALIGAGTFAAYRGRGTEAAAPAPAAVVPEAKTATGTTGAELASAAPAPSAVPSASIATEPAAPPASTGVPVSAGGRKKTRPEPAAAPAPAPAPSPKSAPGPAPAAPATGKPGDQSFDHDFH